jgi:hypothetical protein
MIFVSILETLQGPQPLDASCIWPDSGSAQGHMQGTRGLSASLNATSRLFCQARIMLLQIARSTSTVHEDEERKARVGCSRRERHDANSTSVDVSRFHKTAVQQEQASNIRNGCQKELSFHSHAVRHRKRQVTGDNEMVYDNYLETRQSVAREIHAPVGVVSWPKAHPN